VTETFFFSKAFTQQR